MAFFGGSLTYRPLANLAGSGEPWFTDNYIAGFSVTRELWRVPDTPIVIELDGVVARRFSREREWEFNVQPVVRWTSFPWNSILYTNVRLAPFGFSYATGVSDWELKWSRTDDGSRVLNFLTAELSFKADENADGELFVKTHHRSGIFGLIDDNYGGSTYLVTGYRHKF